MTGWLGRHWGRSRHLHCRGPCGRDLPPSQLVFVNHCYHAGTPHWRCAGLRLLCAPCHRAIGSFDYYAAWVRSHPSRYDVDASLVGLRRFLYALDEHVRLYDVDPSDEEALRLLWQPRLYFEEARGTA